MDKQTDAYRTDSSGVHLQPERIVGQRKGLWCSSACGGERMLHAFRGLITHEIAVQLCAPVDGELIQRHVSRVKWQCFIKLRLP